MDVLRVRRLSQPEMEPFTIDRPSAEMMVAAGQWEVVDETVKDSHSSPDKDQVVTATPDAASDVTKT